METIYFEYLDKYMIATSVNDIYLIDTYKEIIKKINMLVTIDNYEYDTSTRCYWNSSHIYLLFNKPFNIKYAKNILNMGVVEFGLLHLGHQDWNNMSLCPEKRRLWDDNYDIIQDVFGNQQLNMGSTFHVLFYVCIVFNETTYYIVIETSCLKNKKNKCRTQYYIFSNKDDMKNIIKYRYLTKGYTILNNVNIPRFKDNIFNYDTYGYNYIETPPSSP